MITLTFPKAQIALSVLQEIASLPNLFYLGLVIDLALMANSRPWLCHSFALTWLVLTPVSLPTMPSYMRDPASGNVCKLNINATF